MPESYEKLVAWQKAMDMVTKIYKATQTFPREEMYGLTSQLRRAAVSVPSNIAEGKGRLTLGEYRHFLGQARGSLLEAATQIRIAQNLNFLTGTQVSDLLATTDETGRVLNGLIASLGAAPAAARVPNS
ncbi:MAG: four helix bundle protein [Terriglobales bacterium]